MLDNISGQLQKELEISMNYKLSYDTSKVVSLSAWGIYQNLRSS